MSAKIESLKHSVLQLEHAVAINDVDVIKHMARVIADTAQEIANTVSMIEQKETGVYFKRINTIPFLYKPVYTNNPYSGNFLENFSRERTHQLARAGAIDQHNQFWTAHQVINGNIFGSVPKELISEDAVFELKRMGWEEVLVEIIDFGKTTTDIKQLYDFCSANFNKFIFINEQSTKANLALKFAV